MDKRRTDLTDTRTYVLIVERDVRMALIRARWVATHGYEAMLIHTVEGLIETLGYFRPQLVIVGQDQCKSSAQNEISQIVGLIRTVCPGVPMITIEDRTHEDTTEVMFHQGNDHVPVIPV